MELSWNEFRREQPCCDIYVWMYTWNAANTWIFTIHYELVCRICLTRQRIQQHVHCLLNCHWPLSLSSTNNVFLESTESSLNKHILLHNIYINTYEMGSSSTFTHCSTSLCLDQHYQKKHSSDAFPTFNKDSSSNPTGAKQPHLPFRLPGVSPFSHLLPTWRSCEVETLNFSGFPTLQQMVTYVTCDYFILKVEMIVGLPFWQIGS